MSRDLMCSTCNRGVWSDREIVVSVERNKTISLGTLHLWACLRCGREYLAKWFVDHMKIYAARSEEAARVLEATIDDEWYGPLRQQAKRTEEIKHALHDGYVGRVPDGAAGLATVGSTVSPVGGPVKAPEITTGSAAPAAQSADAEPAKRCV